MTRRRGRAALLAALGLAAAGACTAPRDGEVWSWQVDASPSADSVDHPAEDAEPPADAPDGSADATDAEHVSVVLTGDRQLVTALLAFRGALYWGERSGVYRIPPEGGDVELVASSTSVKALAAGGDNLFWIGSDDTGMAVFALPLFPSLGKEAAVVARGTLISLAATPDGQTVFYGLQGHDEVVARDGPAWLPDSLFMGTSLGTALAADPVRAFFVDTTLSGRTVWSVRRAAPSNMTPLYPLPLEEPAERLRIFGGFLYIPVTGKFVRVSVGDGDPQDLPDPDTDGTTRFEVDKADLFASHPVKNVRTDACEGTTFSRRAIGPAGSPKLFARISECASAIALDDTALYWTNETTIGRIPR